MNALKLLAIAVLAVFGAAALAAQNSPPVITVTTNATPIADGTVVAVSTIDTLAAFNLNVSVDDADNDTVFLDVFVSNMTTQGLEPTEWQANAVAPYSVTPTSGVFNVPDVEHTIVLTAFDGTDTTFFSLIVLVAADSGNSAPKLVLQAGTYVQDDTFFTVSPGTTLASLGLSIRPLDADGGLLDVDVFVSNVTTQGLQTGEWTATGTPSGTTLTPTSGAFNVPDVLHTIVLSVSDGMDTTLFRFFVIVSATSGTNTKPKLALFSNGAYVPEGSAVPIPFDTSVRDLGLEARLLDADDFAFDVDVSVSNFTTQGLEPGEWTASGAIIGSYLTPSTGQFNVGDVAHVVSLTVSDGTDSVIYNYILLIGPDGVSSTNAAPFIGVFAGQQYIDNGSTVPLPFNTLVSSLNLRVVVADFEGDPTAASLVGVTNFTTQGLVPAQWEQSASAVPYELNPTSGQFNVGSVDHVVSLAADDGNSVFDYSFTIEVGAGTPPPPASGGDKKKDDDGCTTGGSGVSWMLLAALASMLALAVRQRKNA